VLIAVPIGALSRTASGGHIAGFIETTPAPLPMTRPTRSIAALWCLTLGLLLAGVGAHALGAVQVDSTVASAALESAPAAMATAAPASPQLGGVGQSLDTSLADRGRSLVGLLLLLGLAWGVSTNRRKIAWRLIIWGMALQLVFAVFILKTPIGAIFFDTMNDVVVALLGFTVDGARFIFGDLVFNTVPVGMGVPGTNNPIDAAPQMVAQTGAFFAFNVLPTIIFFSSLMTLLYHLGLMQVIVKGVAWVMQRTMKTSGAETLSAAGNIFVGQTEAPLLIKPFISSMTRSELMAVMTGGFATVAGGVMAAYVGMLVAFFPDIAGHLMAASVMSAPAALVVAKLMVPEEDTPETAGKLAIQVDRPDANVIDAAARGAGEGLHLALNVGAMLLAFIALIELVNALLGWGAGLVGFDGLSLQSVFGFVLAPVAWIMGVPWADARVVGELMGLKTVLNEFVAYLQLSSLLGSGEGLQPRSVIIATYALSGFANFSSIAIQIGGIGGIAPQRRSDLSRLGLRAMVGGTIAAFLTATVAGMLV
jgi:CNT family concentrative nucleoside transporter